MPRQSSTSLTRRTCLYRFWSSVAVGDPDGCWPWLGSLGAGGYGKFHLGGRHLSESAHRFSYSLAHSGIPEGAWILHTCDNRQCVNPAHLYAGTAADNTQDRRTRGRASNPHKANLVGSVHPVAKLSETEVIAIRYRWAAGELQRPLAREYGVSQCLIWRICNRGCWRHI